MRDNIPVWIIIKLLTKIYLSFLKCISLLIHITLMNQTGWTTCQSVHTQDQLTLHSAQLFRNTHTHPVESGPDPRMHTQPPHAV